MSTPEKKEEGEPSAPAPKVALPPNKGTDRTVELDLAQVDLLDLPLPPSSSPKIGSTSKGPPPLPPSLPPEPHADATAADASSGPVTSEEESAAPNAAAAHAPTPTPAPAPASAAAAQVSARKLLEGSAPATAGGSALRFALGLGAATLVCAGLWFGWRALHKSQAATPAATASAIASAAASAPTSMRTITIAPIEMIDTSADRAAASAPEATTTTKPAVGGAGGGATHPATTTHTAPGGTSVKPHTTGSDDVIKVEN